ncbi:diphosphomevalonate decarboxylase [Kiritimatiellaeota bacterium B1221]|nr:diphosphomevalonate decarboxylase [Kiritimatiellaeota bacterium B1221]
MNFKPRDIVDQILPHRTPAQNQAKAYAPANIALCKYWGKRNETLKLPLTGSLSVSLAELGTHMQCRIAETDRLEINGQMQAADSKAFRRLFSFLELFREPGTHFHIQSTNTIPMAAGLASSASAFASAVNCLNLLYGWELSDRSRSILSRIGSGSASRSICAGFVEWYCGEQPNGMDSYAEALDETWPAFRIGILCLSDAEKAVSSGVGMQRTMDTAVLYQSWPTQVARDLPLLRRSIQDKDFECLGKTAEQNAMAMHATMIAAWPPILYWKPESIRTLHRVQQLRAEGVAVYATMDAGPNVKLVFLEPSQSDVQSAFPEMQVVQPFGSTCQD